MLPPQLKTHSGGTLVAHKHKYFCASFATLGYRTASILHQSSGMDGSSIGLVLALLADEW